MKSLSHYVCIAILISLFIKNIKSAVIQRLYTPVHRKSVFLVANKKVVTNYREIADLKEVRNKGFHGNWKKLEDHCLKNGLSNIAADRVVAGCKDGNANQLYEELKIQSKEECMKGKNNVIDGLTVRAGTNFQKALELRYICDYVWVHVLENEGDLGHAQFQWSIKKMIAYCCDPKLWGKPKSDAKALIMALK